MLTNIKDFLKKHLDPRVLGWYRFRKSQVDSIRLLLRENWLFNESQVDSIRLLLRENWLFNEFQLEATELVLKGALNPGYISILKSPMSVSYLRDIEDLIDGAELSYSQEGEDQVLRRYFDTQPVGFYVEIGAHDPKRFSNSYYFYKKGWCGVCIEPTPGIGQAFTKFRPRDYFISSAVSNYDELNDFYMFNESALNTYNQELVREYEAAGYKIVSRHPVEAKKLSNLLSKCDINNAIDFMSIDVEGHELSVLESNDWLVFRPKLLLVEILNFEINSAPKYPVYEYITSLEYRLIAKSKNTLFFEDARKITNVR